MTQNRKPFRRFLAKMCNFDGGGSVAIGYDGTEVYYENGILVEVISEGFGKWGKDPKPVPQYTVISKKNGVQHDLQKENVCFVKYLEPESSSIDGTSNKADTSESSHGKTETKPIINADDLFYKTPAQLIQILGNPTIHDKPMGEIPGNLKWDKGDVKISTEYLPKDKYLIIRFRFKNPNLTLDDKFSIIGLEMPTEAQSGEITGQKHWEPYYSGEMYYEWIAIFTEEAEYDDFTVAPFPNKEHSKKPPPKDPFDDIKKALIKDYHEVEIGSVEKAGKTIKIRYVAENALLGSYIDHAKYQATHILDRK